MGQETMNVTQYKRKHLIKIKIFSNEICPALCVFEHRPLLPFVNSESDFWLLSYHVGGIHNSLHSFLAASSTGGSANRQCCSDFSSVALAAH